MPAPVLTPAGVRAVDARLEKTGLLDLSMEAAGRAGADTVKRFFPTGQVLLLAGGGANGGDALVAARHLLALGRKVTVLALPSKHPLTRRNRRRLGNVGVAVARLSLSALRRALPGADVVVDGLLGTGFTPPLRADMQEMVTLLNAARKSVVSLDVPTGLDASISAVQGEPVQAQVTVTFSGLKPALLYGPAAHWAGHVVLAGLRLPPGWALREAVATQPFPNEVAPLLPKRFADAHKGTAGRVWVVGGHPGTVGAAILAGQAALRGGAGLVTIHSGVNMPLLHPELMAQQHPNLLDFLAGVTPAQQPDAVCVGMGLGPDAAQIAKQVLIWRKPTVLDADALQPELAGHGHDACIWTPHPGEAARLLGVTTADITRDPPIAARALQEKYGGVIVLKGGPTTLATPQHTWVSRGGHPGMASAGMGDTLSGLLAALLAQGVNPPDAALLGVTLHARAGEIAAQTHAYGLTASDVSECLGQAWLELQTTSTLAEHEQNELD